LLITQFGYSQNLFTKGVAKIAKMMAPPAEQVSDLQLVFPTVGIGSNLHDEKLGIVSQAFYKGWKTGGDMT